MRAKSGLLLPIHISNPPWITTTLRSPLIASGCASLVRIIIDLLEHDAFRKLVAERLAPTDADLATDRTLDEWLLRQVSTSHHISSTCKMGPDSDPMAVVDQYGKVYGVEGLWVADASIMPDCIRANTNVTTMVIGERISDFMMG